MVEIDAEKWAQLTRAFGEGEVNLLPKGKGSGDDIQCAQCGGRHKERGIFHVPYVGHARVTNRLNEVDPSWVMVPQPMIFDGDLVYMPVAMTVLGVTRYEVGVGDKGDDEWPKQVYSDAITRSAMRFGIALDLWMKVPPAQESSQRRSRPAQATPASSPVQQRDPTLAAILDVLKADVEHLDMTGMAAWTAWKEEHPKWWADLDTLVAARDLVMGLLVSAASEEPF